MSKTFKAVYIANLVDGQCSDNNIEVNNFSSLLKANKNSISFYSDTKLKEELINSKAGVVILKKSDAHLRSGPSIYVNDPYLAFAKASSLFADIKVLPFIHKNSFIDKDSIIGENLSLGPYSIIESNSRIAQNVSIGANTFIGKNVSIGCNSIIHSNVTIESNVVIGNGCEIFSGARIGTSGFGYAREKDGTWFKIPQVGTVIIGNNVDVGANTTIDRGAIEDTVIHDGVKIDNLVQIAHNCIIGENTIIAGCAGIAGSAIIGKNCMIGGAAMIKGHITIADDTIVSGGSGIGKSVKTSGKRFTNVFPYNIEHKEWVRIANNLKKIGKKND